MTLHANNPLANATQSALKSTFRQFARHNLPPAMLPAHFVLLEQLPRLPNGKVDRKRLPAIENLQLQQEQSAGVQHVEPATPVEVRLAQIWRDLLHLERVSVTDNFFDLGGNSLTVVQMAARIRDEFGEAIALKRVFEQPTLGALAGLLGGGARQLVHARSVDDAALLVDSILPDDIRPQPDALPASTLPYQRILLTGGTGYTGAFLLRELLDRSGAQIDVLTRASDTNDAKARVQQNMSAYGLWRKTDEERLHGVVGDVGRPWLGLSQTEYQQLAQQTELIIHNGALSNYAQSYWQLKPVNVLGTQEVLRLACHARIKPVHYVSSLAVFPVRSGTHTFPEDALHSPSGVIGGYQQTKWVADRLVTQAGERGLLVCIYRPGQITGAWDNGAAAPDTFLSAVIKGCIQLKAGLPFDITLEMVPVDFCAAAIAYIALSGQHHGQHFHLTGGRRVYWQEVTDLIRQCGYPLQDLPYEQWYQKLVQAIERGQDNELASYLVLFAEDAPSPEVGATGAVLEFGTSRLQQALSGSGLISPQLDVHLMQRYLDYFCRSGFLPDALTLAIA